MSKYGHLYTCQSCGGLNTLSGDTHYDGNHVSESGTVCGDCGFESYWAYGFFVSEPEDLPCSHEWVFQDDSFDNGFCMEIHKYYECRLCGERISRPKYKQLWERSKFEGGFYG